MLEKWLGKHPVFNEGAAVTASDGLFAEFKACMALGIDPDVQFNKERNMRRLITGGVVAANAIDAMRQYDAWKERENERGNK